MIDLDKLIFKLEQSLYYGKELNLSINELEFMLNYYKSLIQQEEKEIVLKRTKKEE